MLKPEIIGSKIEFEFKKDIIRVGRIMAQIDMLHQDRNSESGSQVTVTGFMVIDDTTDKVIPITYWRVVRFL